MEKNKNEDSGAKEQSVQRVSISLPNDLCEEMDKERMTTLTPRTWWIKRAIEGELERIKNSKKNK